MKSITQSRICAQPLFGNQLTKLNAIINSNLPLKEKEKLRANSLIGTIWPQKSVINIRFIEKVPNNIEITKEEDIARSVVMNNKYVFIGPDGDIDPKTGRQKIYQVPYRTSEGYVLDKNGKPVIPDPLEKTCRELIEKAKATRSRIKIDSVVKDCIKRIIRERLQPFINLTLNFLDDKDRTIKSQINIGFNTEDGAWSYVGTDNIKYSEGGKTMNLGWFDVATVIHEFGHMLGLQHEHQTPTGGFFNNQLIWNTTALYKWGDESQGWNRQDVNQQIINRNKIDQTNDLSVFKNGVTDKRLLEYDPDSVMLYFYEGFLTYDPIGYNSKPQVLKPGPGTTQNLRLSVKDVLYLNALYPGQRANGSLAMTGQQFIDINPELFKKATSLRSIERYREPVIWHMNGVF